MAPPNVSSAHHERTTRHTAQPRENPKMTPTSPPSTPHIELISRALIRRDSRVLLCRNTKHGYFYLPGGHVEFGEAAPDAAARELLEETGLHIIPGPCLLICEVRFTQSGRPRHEVNMVFRGVFHVEHPLLPPAPPAPDTSDPPIISLEPGISFEWIDLAAVPDIDLRPTIIKAWLVSGGAVRDTDRTGWLSVEE